MKMFALAKPIDAMAKMIVTLATMNMAVPVCFPFTSFHFAYFLLHDNDNIVLRFTIYHGFDRLWR